MRYKKRGEREGERKGKGVVSGGMCYVRIHPTRRDSHARRLRGGCRVCPACVGCVVMRMMNCMMRVTR